MKALVAAFLILFFSVEYSHAGSLSKNYSQLTPNPLVNLNFKEVSKMHLDLIFSDLIDKNIFSKNKITILNSYVVLNGYQFQKDGYSFAVVEKSDLNIDQANQIFFWRMDVKATSAHYEFYLNQSNDITVKYEYLFELVNGQWLIQ
ncbi:hypothetical protein ACRASX_15315 [Flavobacterium sp. TMP13]|uniref:hypothetical protein n=1 Tax=Flavobacterium sp. TMP13 TaxID=3425950 RepID=UPI003D77D572